MDKTPLNRHIIHAHFSENPQLAELSSFPPRKFADHGKVCGLADKELLLIGDMARLAKNRKKADRRLWDRYLRLAD
jgi:hypothetical protein